jgi:hypothetical protein
MGVAKTYPAARGGGAALANLSLSRLIKISFTDRSGVKVKLSLYSIKHQALNEDVWGSRGIAPRILNLSTSWRSAAYFAPEPLHLCCLFSLLFQPEDGSSTLLRNVSKLLPGGMASHRSEILKSNTDNALFY